MPVVPQALAVPDQLKYEVAREQGIRVPASSVEALGPLPQYGQGGTHMTHMTHDDAFTDDECL